MTFRIALPMLVLTLLVSACGTRDHFARPSMPNWQTDAATCEWHWREGGGIGLWAESCVLNGATWQVIWDADRAAFANRRDGALMGIAVQGFALPPGAGIAALNETLIAAGQLEPDAACAWRAIALRAFPRTMTLHSLAPIDSAAFAPTANGEVPNPICGPYGASTHGARYFITDLRWPNVAIFVEEGQERPLFDPRSINWILTNKRPTN